MRFPALAVAVTIGGQAFAMTAQERENRAPGEVTIDWGKHGSTTAGLMDAYAGALSLGLSRGVPLADLIEPGLGMNCPPNGHTNDPEIPRARSVIDYISRRLALDWLPYHERAALGVLTLTERVEQASDWIEAHEPAARAASIRERGLPRPVISS